MTDLAAEHDRATFTSFAESTAEGMVGGEPARLREVLDALAALDARERERTGRRGA